LIIILRNLEKKRLGKIIIPPIRIRILPKSHQVWNILLHIWNGLRVSYTADYQKYKRI
jgi:hypothetical protein